MWNVVVLRPRAVRLYMLTMVLCSSCDSPLLLSAFLAISLQLALFLLCFGFWEIFHTMPSVFTMTHPVPFSEFIVISLLGFALAVFLCLFPTEACLHGCCWSLVALCLFSIVLNYYVALH